MDDVIIERILELVKNSNGIKASKIAKQLKISRKEVNKILYGRLAKLCVQDEQYLWYCSAKEDLTICGDFMEVHLDKMEKAFKNTEFNVEDLEKFLQNINK